MKIRELGNFGIGEFWIFNFPISQFQNPKSKKKPVRGSTKPAGVMVSNYKL